MTGDAGGANAATLEIVCAALRSGDLASLEPVLTADVLWDGCRSRGEVMATLRAAFDGDDAYPQLSEARLHGDRAVLHVAWPEGPRGPAEHWYVLAFDDAGLVTRMQGYDDAATVDHDLALLAAGPPASDAGRPPAAVSGLVPFVHVAAMARSLAFYALLGLVPVDSFAPDEEVVWAFLEGDGASLMLAQDDARIDHRAQGVLFYLYAHDLAGLRDHLVAHGVAAGEIVDGSPGPRNEMRVEDPDGYVLMIAQIEA